MTWIVSTNSNLCRIYSFEPNQKKLTLLKTLSHPENRHKSGDYFTSDKPGHYQSGTAHGSYEPHTDPKKNGIQHFAREITETLNQARTKNEYTKLILIAEPHMMGILLENCDKHIKELIVNEIHKDIVHYTDHELLTFLKDQ